MVINKQVRAEIFRLKREGFGYRLIQKKLGLKSTSTIRWVLNAEYRKKHIERSTNRYNKLKEMGICPQCGNPIKKHE